MNPPKKMKVKNPQSPADAHKQCLDALDALFPHPRPWVDRKMTVNPDYPVEGRDSGGLTLNQLRDMGLVTHNAVDASPWGYTLYVTALTDKGR